MNLSIRKRIAELCFQDIDWMDATHGRCECPGSLRHAVPHNEAEVSLEDPPTIACINSGCLTEVQKANQEFRRVIGRLEKGRLSTKDPAIIAEIKAQEARRGEIERQAPAQMRDILQSTVCASEWLTLSPMPLGPPGEGGREHQRSLLRLFEEDQIVWMGDRLQSGKREHRQCFRPVRQWLLENQVLGPWICPARYMCADGKRSGKSAVFPTFAVFDSGLLPKDQAGAVFEWIGDQLSLVAIVEASQVRQAWYIYDYKFAGYIELRATLAGLGMESNLLRICQTVHLPGPEPGTHYERRLLYLDLERATAHHRKLEAEREAARRRLQEEYGVSAATKRPGKTFTP